MPKCDLNKVAKQLYWNRTSAWVFSCKFAAYFQNTFLFEHLWRAASFQYFFLSLTNVTNLHKPLVFCVLIVMINIIQLPINSWILQLSKAQQLEIYRLPKYCQKQPPRGVIKKRCSENTKQLYWNHTSVWVFSCEFAAYFQNTFS